MARVLIADDHELVRMGIRRLLEENSDHQVVGEVADGEDAVQQTRALDPDIVLMDLHMPGMGGMEATRRILQRDPKRRVVILTSYTDGPLPKAVLEAGALGFITKGCPLDEMLSAIAKVMQGRRHIAHEVAERMALAVVAGDDASPFERLSERELQVVIMVARGLRNQQIAESLNVSPKTISTYRARLMAKLEIETPVELVRLAMQHGLTEQPGPK